MDAKDLKTHLQISTPLQHYNHYKVLEAILGGDPEHLHSLITFVSGSAFKSDTPANVTDLESISEFAFRSGLFLLGHL